MRILLTNHFPFHGSGTGTSTFDLATGLRAAGHDVRCLIVDREREGTEEFPVRRVVCNGDLPGADIPFDLPSFTTHPKSHRTFFEMSDDELALYRDVLREAIDDEVTKFDPQIIHCQHIWIQGSLVLETGVPYVLSAQEINLLAYRQEPRYQLLAAQGAENAGRILADSDWMVSEVCSVYDLDPERVAKIPNAVNLSLYQQPPAPRPALFAELGLPVLSGPLVVYGGKFVKIQGVDVLLNAAAHYEAEHPDVITVIGGDGPEEAALRRQLAELGLKRTFIVSDPSRKQLAQLYSHAHLTVVPSRRDAFELSAIESLASGTPVLASNVGGTPELIQPTHGGLFPSENPAALSSCVLQALQENWKKSKGPYASQYAAAQHSIDMWVLRVSLVYHTVVDERYRL